MTTASSMITCAGCKHSYADSALFCPNCGTPKARREAMPSSDPLVGKILGDRFQVLELLGQGGSGTIYRAEHVTLRRKVAIKVLHDELSRDDLAVERFRREATTVAEIDNEHIVEIHDFGRTPDGRLYLAMELLEGETLDHVLLREKQLSVERAADVLIQVGEALMEAHAIGYVHRDLRPRNIYLAVRRGKANFIKLLDFGLAKLVDTDAQAASTSLGMTFGDPRYMSPEQARGDRIDRRADIYQLGCVAYEMMTGEPPFTGTRVFDILSKQVTEIPAPLPTRRQGVPLWLEAAVTKMLAKDPENRFATTTRMVEALRRGLETGEVMEDEIARRRESIPPPSVSRVMQKMGINAMLDTPRTDTPKPMDQPVIGKETLKGHLEGPLGNAIAHPPGNETLKGHLEGPLPPLPIASPEPRRRTGTPQLGVPAVTQSAVAGQIERQVEAPRMPASVVAPSVPVQATPSVQIAPHAGGSGPVAGVVRAPDAPSGPTPAAPGTRSPSQLGPGDSSAWFDEGDSAFDDSVRARKLISTSTTDLSMYEETLQRRRWPRLVGGLVALVVVGGIAFALTRGDETQPAANPQPVATTPTPPPPAMDVPPSQIIAPDGSAAPPAPVVESESLAAAKPKEADKRPAKTPVKSSGSSAKTAKTSGKSSTATGDGPRRPTGGGWFDSSSTTPTPTPTPPPVTTPTPTPSGVSGTDGPVDPYGGTDASATEPPAPEKKAEFFANLGKQQLASGDAAGAAASFKKALEIDAKNIPAIIGMGEIALRQGLFGDAISHLKKASRLAPKSSHVMTLLGEAYLGTGNHKVASETFQKALQLDPENVRARDGFTEAQSRVPPAEDDMP